MHFVTGGYFNGKSKWVRNHYGMKERNDFTWVSSYKNDNVDQLFQNKKVSFYILEGLEIFLKNMLETNLDISYIRDQVQKMISDGLAWEHSSDERKFIVIGTDISKGVVPIEKKDRLWRDLTGWVYQDIVSRSEKVDFIWYGISRTLK
ncbi:bifunctional adenosylcobinamide kinase/adenosylcobinamide-phosphate guanylyltransferase [Heyndrickxia sp. NPDC080065]|uniref:bifunctional adenosylcobinamide kinase/adenosylcobinamide-phosphate guanylyltransferase n=1 Tax=Heyndrickxia sp. NPDC080065 TaxID=3390568 RepID=UPI003CFC7257